MIRLEVAKPLVPPGWVWSFTEPFFLWLWRVGIWDLNLTFTPKDNHEHLCWKQEHSTYFKMENLRSQVKWRHGKRGGSSGVYPGNLSGKRTAAGT